MDELIETHPGSWILVAGPRAIRATMLTLIARLAERGPVRVLDGGNQFNAYLIARQLRGQPNLLSRISISRMFTCYQVLAALEKASELPMPLVMLDFLRTFYDESVPFHERRRLVSRCIPHLRRLSVMAGGAVSIHPPAVTSSEAETLFAILAEAAAERWIQDPPAPIQQPGRLC
jgi:hypothetical protein